MKTFTLPTVLLILGTAGGVGAAKVFAPALSEPDALPEVGLETTLPCGPDGGAAAENHTADDKGHGPASGDVGYARLDNQFVVPLVVGDRVASLVVLSLSVEVPDGQQDLVYTQEPKLRDAFVQVLFDHSNAGGFAGAFTSAGPMGELRSALRRAAQAAIGPQVSDVLILELVRQDIAG